MCSQILDICYKIRISIKRSKPQGVVNSSLNVQTDGFTPINSHNVVNSHIVGLFRANFSVL